MKAAGLAEVVLEVRKALTTIQDKEARAPIGPLVVSGALAEQLVRELGAGAVPGAVVVGEAPTAAGAEVVVRVLAGDPGEAEDALVREADRLGTPVVFVQLWPQANWSALFVLSPFVIECRAGEGFPVATIAEMVARASRERGSARGANPRPQGAGRIERRATGGVSNRPDRRHRRAEGPARPLITLEQLRMLSSLRAADRLEPRSEIPPAAVAAATVAASFGLRTLARTAGRSLPVPLVNAVVAAGGTWALAKAIEALHARAQSPLVTPRIGSVRRGTYDARGPSDGRSDAGHGAGRRAATARRSRRVVRVPRVHARSDGDALRRSRTVGMGAPVPAAARRSRAPFPASPGSGIESTPGAQLH